MQATGTLNNHLAKEDTSRRLELSMCHDETITAHLPSHAPHRNLMQAVAFLQRSVTSLSQPAYRDPSAAPVSRWPACPPHHDARRGPGCYHSVECLRVTVRVTATVTVTVPACALAATRAGVRRRLTVRLTGTALSHGASWYYGIRVITARFSG